MVVGFVVYVTKKGIHEKNAQTVPNNINRLHGFHVSLSLSKLME
jgi:hypothetical protein